MFYVIHRLILNSEILDEATLLETKVMVDWAVKHLLEQNILTVENWLEVAYHLCKQRWDESIDWLETQPMSKIHTMIEIVKDHAKQVKKEQEKAAKKK